jgi:transposase
MQVLHPHCVGIDVHKDSVVVCVRHHVDGGEPRLGVRTFGTKTRELLELGDWLAQEGVTQGAMESTGVYWRPVWNLLESGLSLLLVNPQHMRQVPGRKTDVKDCQWIAELLAHGLLKGGFVPEMELRDLRDLTRQRAQLMQDRSRVASRIQKVLEGANIKLASVASDVLGVSGRDMLEAIVAGDQDAGAMAAMARARMRSKLPQLKEALSGRVRDHHRFMLKQLLAQVDQLDAQVRSFDARIEEVMSPLMKAAATRLDSVPGVDRRSAQVIVAEIGCDMGQFPTSGHLAAWAGLSPGNNQSGGKRRNARTGGGSRWLKRTLTQCAWAATRKKDCYLASQYRRLKGRRGAKRAVMAVAHSMLVSSYEMLKRGQDFIDLGPNYFDQFDQGRLTKQLVQRLSKLGYKVTLEAA